jgi:hypothetical protein
MSILTLQKDTSFQSGDAFGNISHQGVLGSNVGNTPLLTSNDNYNFPTTSTGDSVGHYHYTEPTTNALQFLNASGTGTGGHIFYTSNSTTAPIETGKFDTNGMTITQDNTITTYDTYSVIVSNPTFIIINTNPSVPPYNWLLGNMYVIQVGNTTSTMSIGVNYNVKYIDSQAIRVYTTSSDTSPVIDSSGITSVLIPTGTTGQIDTAILSATDLTFNTVSLQETLTTLQIKQTTSSNQYISAVITADARPPTAPTTTITQQFGYTPAWFFQNSFASGTNKINWYLAGDIGMTVSQVLGLYMNIFNPSMTSNDNCPFIVILTTNDTPNPPNFYKSKRTYLFNQSITPVVNTRYCMFSNVSGTCPTPFHYASVLNNMELSTVAGSNVGAFAPTEVILAFSIHTNSASAINSVEFALSKFGIMTPYGTQEVLFIPST